MSNWAAKTGTLELFARRLAYFSTTVLETQDLLGIEGCHDEPWSAEYQQRAVEVYRMTLPPYYLAQLASSFAGVVLVLDHRFGAESEKWPWSILKSYFGSAQSAIASQLEVTVVPSATEPVDASPTTPGAVRFDVLAGEVSKKGIHRQIEAAESAVASIRRSQRPECPPEYRRWLIHLANGGTVLDLAVDSGFSERTMYRSLKQMWVDLGVANLRQGVSLAVENGWLEERLP